MCIRIHPQRLDPDTNYMHPDTQHWIDFTHLRLRMDEADALLVDGNEQQLRIVGIRRLLHLEEGGPEGRPPVDDFQEGDLRLLGRHARVLVVRLHDLPLPVLRAGFRIIRIDLIRIRIQIRIQLFSNCGFGSRIRISDPDPGSGSRV
jgi:hypothetical protein